MSPPTRPSEFAQLGTGSASDRLRFKLVLQILWRTIPLMQPVRAHLGALLATLIVFLLLGIPVTLILTDVLFTRVLQGKALTPVEASVLWLDAAEYADLAEAGSELAPEQRQVIRDRWLVALILLGLPALLIGAALLYYAIWILQRINQVLRVALLERIQTLSLRFHADSRVGDAVYRLFQDSAMVTNVIETLFLRPAQFVLIHGIAFAIVFGLDPWLGLTLLLVWPPTLVIGLRFSGRLRAGFRRAREANSAVTSRIQETLSGIRVIKAYGAEGDEQARFERDSLAAFEVAFHARSLYATYGVMTFWVAGSALIAGLVRASLQARAGADLFAEGLFGYLAFTAWNYGLFGFFRQRFGQGTSSVEQLMSLWGRAQDIAIGLDRVYELLDLEPEVRDRPDAIDMRGLRERIVFRGVGFAYEADRPVLDKIDFEARPGSITAIVGPTGSGKSTLMSLLLRLFDPDRGAIEIDGVDLRKLRIGSLRDSIAIALQENILFATTVRENIRYAVSNADDEAVRSAARVAGAAAFIDELPDGYDTMLGERGTKLSTGQRQRLSIARAVLKDTPILILDEPTAALDAETEIEVLTNLAEWGRLRAIFLITHRLSTVRRADQILVLRDGSVAEYGRHEELMRLPDGRYRRLFQHEEAPQARASGGS